MVACVASGSAVNVFSVVNQFKLVGRGSNVPPGKRNKTVKRKTENERSQ
jgi:hypothetical protein